LACIATRTPDGDCFLSPLAYMLGQSGEHIVKMLAKSAAHAHKDTKVY